MVNSQPPRKKFRGAVIGDKVNSDRLVGILWSHPVFNLKKSRGAVMGDSKKSDRFVGISWSHPVFNLKKSCSTVIRRLGDRVNGDRSLVKGGNISSVRNTIASIHIYKGE